ncbi:MAG: ion transporter [marine bacterium B5-7]|nr:MAG: ion transporter [marine bacterium B5-7]
MIPMQTETHEPSWLDKLSKLLSREPQDQAELVQLLRDAHGSNLLDADSLDMIEGVLQVSGLQARDIMIPKAQMVVIQEDQTLDAMLPVIVDSAHSRFPVFDTEDNEVIGILLAKDLLGVFLRREDQQFDLHELLRPVIVVPESKRLDALLRVFRKSHNHMAVVIDEYGAPAGLVTIEDVLEQIVGEIEDEHDIDPKDTIKTLDDGTYTIKALTTLEAFNLHFGTQYNDDEFDTIGGLMNKKAGKLPEPGDIIIIDQFEFTVLRADQRRVHLLKMKKIT